MSFKFANQATATLASSISAASTSIVLTTGQGSLFPSITTGYTCRGVLVDSSNNVEFVTITARIGDNLTVVRAEEGSAARAFSAGSRLELRVTSGVLDNFPQLNKLNTFTAENRFDGNTRLSTVSGNPTFSDNVSVTGIATLNGAAVFNAAVTFNAGGSLGGSTYTGNAVFNGNLTFNGANAFTGTNTITGTLIMANSAYVLGKDSGGTNRNVLVFASDNTLNLFNSGNTSVRVLNQAGSATLVTLTDASGNLTATGDITSSSDERLKKNWLDFADDFVERLAQVKHGIYERTDTGLVQVGVGAQSLQGVMPNAIHEDESGYLSVAYGQAALAACVALAKRVVRLEQGIKG